MTNQLMTIDRVLELISAYGAESAAWPEQERPAAQAILAAHPEAFTAALQQARALDTQLQAERVPEPDLALREAILAGAPAEGRTENSWLNRLSRMFFPQGARWPAGAALASLMMGLVGGYAYAATGAGYDQADAAYYAAFGFDTNTAWMDLE